MNVRILILLLAVGAAAAWLFIQKPELHAGLYLLLGLFTACWLLSLLLKNSSIVDILWGPAFGIMAWFYLFTSHGVPMQRNVLFCILISMWGLRLGWHIGLRNVGKPEDPRYQAFRQQGGKHYWWISLFRVFGFQALIVWVLSSMFYQAMDHVYAFHLTDFLGIALWLLGYYLESKADRQLADFRKNPANAGKVMDQGLWKYSRHPNYFGDALLWWGLFCFVLPTEGGWVYVFAPLIMTYLLRFVSGVPLLEARLKKKAGYEAYMQRTSAFVPMPPKEKV